jgi:hypothetical protein
VIVVSVVGVDDESAVPAAYSMVNVGESAVGVGKISGSESVVRDMPESCKNVPDYIQTININ